MLTLIRGLGRGGVGRARRVGLVNLLQRHEVMSFPKEALKPTPAATRFKTWTVSEEFWGVGPQEDRRHFLRTICLQEEATRLPPTTRLPSGKEFFVRLDRRTLQTTWGCHRHPDFPVILSAPRL